MSHEGVEIPELQPIGLEARGNFNEGVFGLQSPFASSHPYLFWKQYSDTNVSIRQHPSAFVSIRQHTSAFVSILCWKQYSDTHTIRTLRSHFVAHFGTLLHCAPRLFVEG